MYKIYTQNERQTKCHNSKASPQTPVCNLTDALKPLFSPSQIKNKRDTLFSQVLMFGCCISQELVPSWTDQNSKQPVAQLLSLIH